MKGKKLLAILCLLVSVIGCHSPENKNGNVVITKEDTSTQNNGFHFFVLGDWGRRGVPVQQAVANQMIAYAKRRHPAFIITAGDNFYQHGVQSVNDPHWTQSFTNVYKELTQHYNWYAVLGNHDYEGLHANPKAEMDYHRVNPHWNMPYYYSTMVAKTADSQLVRFVFIDTNPFYRYYHVAGEYPFIHRQDTAQQRRWIDTTLANAKEPWKFVVGHHPVYSAGLDHGNTAELIKILQPILEKNKVQAYICGHEHNLEHLRPAGSYVDYFVCGAGSVVNGVGKTRETKFALSVPGFADLRIKGDSLFLQYIDTSGHIVYNYARKR
jgi:predicted MPP superfamily phosphohydrolase